MSLLFLDTSALMKLYIAEVGSSWLRNYVTNNQIGISELALYEAATVLRRRFLEATINQAQAVALYARLQKESTGFEVLDLRVNRQLERVVDMSLNQPGQLRLRALDSIHLAAAQVMQEAANLKTPPEPFIFISSDLQLLKAAQSLRLNTQNPEAYP